MPTLNPEHIKSVIEMINQGHFFMHMAMRVTELDTIGYSKVKVVATIGKKHMDPFGGLH